MAEKLTVTLGLWARPLHDPVAQAALDAARAAESDGELATEPVALRPATIPGQLVDEANAPGFFRANPDRLATYGTLEGVVAIDDGHTRAAFGDTLMWLAPKLCLEAVRTLLDTGAATVPLFSSASELTLRRDGDRVAFTADIMAPTSFPADQLLHALADAGRRLLALVPTLWPDDELARDARPALEAELSETLARLEQAGDVGAP